MYTVYIIKFLWPDLAPFQGPIQWWWWRAMAMSTHLHEQSQKEIDRNCMVKRIHGRYKVFGAKGHIPGGSKSEKFVDLTNCEFVIFSLGEVKEIGEEAMNGSGLKLHIPFQMRELSQAEGFHWWSLVRPSHRCCKGLDTCFLKEVSGNQTTSHN